MSNRAVGPDAVPRRGLMTLFDAAAQVSRQFGPVGALAARGIELYAQGLTAAERAAMGLLRSRLEATSGAAPLALGSSSGLASSSSPANPSDMMTSLLTRSLEQNPEASRQEYHVSLLRQLVPDEARIMASLAEEGPAPLVSVYKRGTDELLLEHASMIGRRAAVTLPSLTRQYVARLMSLGLVEAGPEAPGDKLGYELLTGDKEVRAAMKAGGRGKIPARVVRATVHLSPRGHELYEAIKAPHGQLP